MQSIAGEAADTAEPRGSEIPFAPRARPALIPLLRDSPPTWKGPTVTVKNRKLPHSLGITRREWLQVGYSGLLGIGLSSLLAQRASCAERGRTPGASSRQPKSVILIFLTGA